MQRRRRCKLQEHARRPDSSGHEQFVKTTSRPFIIVFRRSKRKDISNLVLALSKCRENNQRNYQTQIDIKKVSTRVLSRNFKNTGLRRRRTIPRSCYSWMLSTRPWTLSEESTSSTRFPLANCKTQLLSFNKSLCVRQSVCSRKSWFLFYLLNSKSEFYMLHFWKWTNIWDIHGFEFTYMLLS